VGTGEAPRPISYLSFRGSTPIGAVYFSINTGVLHVVLPLSVRVPRFDGVRDSPAHRSRREEQTTRFAGQAIGGWI
jgi:hypothetical protein